MRLHQAMIAASASVAMLCAGVQSADAIAINYGDFVGNTVNFLQVTEDSGTDPTPLYGAPSVFADSLDFNPVGFLATATGAGGNDITDGTLSLMMTSKPGHFIDQVKFDEAGDFTLVGLGGAGTFVSVTANFNVEIAEVDGVGVGSILIAAPMVFTPSNGDWDLANDGPGPLVSGGWSGMLMVDLTQALIDNGVPYVNGVTKINVVFDNTLVALSEDGTSSVIAKKDVGGIGITVVPEPASFALLALGGLGLIRKRR